VTSLASFPLGITAGPDGALWFTEAATNNIGRITTSGTISEYAIPTQPAGAYNIVAGPDGNLWFTEEAGNNIGQITPTGVVTEFAVPTSASLPTAILKGPDNGLWFTEWAGNKIARSDTSGNMVEYQLPSGIGYPLGLTTGPDGALWFTEGAITNRIGRITLAGAFTEYTVGAQQTATSTTKHLPTSTPNPGWLVSGPDGAIWFTEAIGAIGRFSAPAANGKDRRPE
jgi:virginiamycin B lyase